VPTNDFKRRVRSYARTHNVTHTEARNRLRSRADKPAQSTTTHQSGWGSFPKKDFSSFVVTSSNRDAFAATSRIAEATTTAHNPFVILGETGSGKTRLLRSLHLRRKELFPGLRVSRLQYSAVHAAWVVDDGTRTAPRPGSTTDLLTEQSSGTSDLLVIDDIDRVPGTQVLADSLAECIAAATASGTQIAVSTRVPLEELGPVGRQLGVGHSPLVVRLEVPEADTAVAVLHSWAQQVRVDIPQPVLDLIASKAPSNLRELEFAFVNVVGFAILNRQPIDLEFAEQILASAFEEERELASA
jgi:chromosomal replication initiator protein